MLHSDSIFLRYKHYWLNIQQRLLKLLLLHVNLLYFMFSPACNNKQEIKQCHCVITSNIECRLPQGSILCPLYACVQLTHYQHKCKTNHNFHHGRSQFELLGHQRPTTRHYYLKITLHLYFQLTGLHITVW